MKQPVRCLACLLAALLLTGAGCASAPSRETQVREMEQPGPGAGQPAIQAPEPPEQAAAKENASGQEDAKRQKALQTIRSLSGLGLKTLPHLIKLSQVRDPEVRLTAVQTLGLMDLPEVVAPLIHALGDEDAAVRENAARMLILKGPLMTQQHVDKLLSMVRHGKKQWPDPASEYVISINHYAGKVLAKARSPFITPAMASEADEAIMRY